MDQLKNKIALVTGSSRGIGKAIAVALANEGVNVVVNYHTGKSGAQEVCKIIESKGVKAWAIQADVSEGVSVALMMSEIEAEIGNINILVNNAGISLRRKVEETTEEDFDKVIRVNLKSSFLVTQAVLPQMRKAESS